MEPEKNGFSPSAIQTEQQAKQDYLKFKMELYEVARKFGLADEFSKKFLTQKTVAEVMKE